MKVVLATSPHVRHAAVLQSDFAPERTAMYSFAPVGLLSLAAVLRAERPDFTCSLYDLNRRILLGVLPLNRSFYAAAAADVCAGSPDVVGFMTECDSYHHVLQIAREIKRAAPETRVVLGGPHASVVSRQTIERCEAVDAIVIGEGELTFPDLLDAFLSGGPQRPLPGALVRGGPRGGRQPVLLEGTVRQPVGALDDLPIPAYDIYAADPGEEVFLEVGRGCPFQCTFCSTAPYWNRRHRVKSPDRILEEVLRVRQLFDAARCHFTHDLFTTNRKWVRAVCETLINAGVPITWTCSARTDTVDEELLELMARAGCDAIYFGIESGSQRVLREIRKDIPLEDSFAILRACREAGITPNAGFIVGLPQDDATSLGETFAAYERALRLGCRPTHLFAFCPFAGASMYESLGELTCSGHFVDLPLGSTVDAENRRRIAADRDLFGAYFRPPLRHIVAGVPDAIPAVDEFSPLVEAALWPTLALADLCGGMAEVFRRWLTWIHSYNDVRGAARYRRGYGSPAIFARFVLNELLAFENPPPGAVEAAHVVELNLRVIEGVSLTAGTTMASYRSLVVPSLAEDVELTLATTVAPADILATFAADYDVTPALAGDVRSELEPVPTRLLWQLTESGDVRLLRVERPIFELINRLAGQSKTVAELVLAGIGADGGSPTRSDREVPIDAEELLSALGDAAQEGLVRV